MTDKEKIECLSDLCRFLSKLNNDVQNSIWKAVSHENDTRDKVINQLIIKTPMMGFRQQTNIESIGNQKTNKDNISKAVNYLLGE